MQAHTEPEEVLMFSFYFGAEQMYLLAAAITEITFHFLAVNNGGISPNKP